eukprot:scaffold7769_cov53-Attheya_sp.AAC.5
MDDEDVIWITRKTWILVQAGPLGQFIMVWWIVGHIKVKNRQKELFEGHTHYGGMPYRLEFFCNIDEKCRQQREREAWRKLVQQLAEQLFGPESYKTFRQGQPWCPKTRCYDDDVRDQFFASIDPLRLFHVLSLDLMQPRVKTKALQLQSKRLKRACIAALSKVQPGANVDLDKARVYFNLMTSR